MQGQKERKNSNSLIPQANLLRVGPTNEGCSHWTYSPVVRGGGLRFQAHRINWMEMIVRSPSAAENAKLFRCGCKQWFAGLQALTQDRTRPDWMLYGRPCWLALPIHIHTCWSASARPCCDVGRPRSDSCRSRRTRPKLSTSNSLKKQILRYPTCVDAHCNPAATEQPLNERQFHSQPVSF